MELSEKYYPYPDEKPSEAAYRLGKIISQNKKQSFKQKFGQYFTPLVYAKFMAEFASIKTIKSSIKILDPGSGLAVLSCALIEKLIQENAVSAIQLICYEIDQEILPLTEICLKHLSNWLKERNVKLNYKLIENDFLTANAQTINNSYSPDNKETYYFDYIISNPPFFKLHEKDERIKLLHSKIKDRPNIYFLFLNVAANLLDKDGIMIFFIPRSFCCGGFYRQYREKFLEIIKLEKIHLFKGTEVIFEDSGVLYDSVVIKASKARNQLSENLLEISSSNRGSDKTDNSYSYTFNKKENIIFLPDCSEDVKIIEEFKINKGSLRKHNYEIQQGTILPSLAEKYLVDEHERNVEAAPYLSYKNIYAARNVNGDTSIVPDMKIRICEDTEKYAIPNKNYILFNRYITKLKIKKLKVIAYYKDSNSSEKIFIDRQLNYIHKAGEDMCKEEIEKLTSLLNSSNLNRYIQIINGGLNITTDILYDIPLP